MQHCNSRQLNSTQQWAAPNHRRSKRLAPLTRLPTVGPLNSGSYWFQLNSTVGSSQPLEASKTGAAHAAPNSRTSHQWELLVATQPNNGQLSTTEGLKDWCRSRGPLQSDLSTVGAIGFNVSHHWAARLQQPRQATSFNRHSLLLSLLFDFSFRAAFIGPLLVVRNGVESG